MWKYLLETKQGNRPNRTPTSNQMSSFTVYDSLHFPLHICFASNSVRIPCIGGRMFVIWIFSSELESEKTLTVSGDISVYDAFVVVSTHWPSEISCNGQLDSTAFWLDSISTLRFRKIGRASRMKLNSNHLQYVHICIC